MSRAGTLPDAEEMLDTVLSTPSIILFVLDDDGTIDFVGGNGLEPLEIDPDDHVNRRVQEIYRDSPEVLEALKAALRGEVTHAQFSVGRTMLDVRFNPRLDSDGEVDKVVGIAEVIEEKVHMKERFEDVQTMGDVGFWEWNIPEDEVYWSDNLYRMFGVSPEEDLTLDSFMEMVHPGDKEKVDSAIQTAMETGTPYHVEVRVNPQDGGEKWIAAAGNMYTDTEGEPFMVRGIVKDITQFKETQEKLEEAYDELKTLDKAKDEFIMTASHELKTPLTPIMGYSEMLRDGVFGELTDEQREKLDVIRANSEQLAEYISQMLDLSRLEAGTVDVSAREQDVMELVDTVVENFGPMAEERDASITVEGPEEAIACMDRDKTDRVLSNLVRNALQYGTTGEEKDVTITVSEGETEVTVEVMDNGPGFGDVEEHIFEKFYRSEKSRKHAEGGMGIGLHLSRRLVELQGGSMEAESKEGEGATLRFTLPKEEPQA